MKLYRCPSYILLLFSSCSFSANTQPSESEGCISSKMDKYSNDNIPAFSSTDTVWFKDNQIIMQNRGIFFNTDTAGVLSVHEYLISYAYINYDTKQFALYSSFSDTAQYIKKYPTFDSLFKVVGTDYFANSKKTLDFVVKTEAMEDTVINNVFFKRRKYYKKWKNKEFISIGYLRCDKPNSNFSIFKNAEDSCSLVKIFDYNRDGTVLNGSLQTEFLSDVLTEQERIVFEAWRKQMTKPQE